MYVMIGTQTDLVFAVGKMSQFLESSTSLHCTVENWILRCNKSTIELETCFSSSEPFNANEFSDSTRLEI